MSLWQELKKRKVIRVGVAYIIVAWLLVQVADIFFPALKLPEWTITLVAGMVILGFPLALILAWAYDLTPHDAQPASGHPVSEGSQAPSGNKLNYAILALLVIVVSMLLFDRFVMDKGGSIPGQVEVARQNRGSVIAGVIPLPEDKRLAFGIADIGFDGPLIALSPNGRWLVYVGRSENGSQLYRHDLSGFEPATPIAGTEGAIHAFFSPDGETIGFITDDKLKQVSLDGREASTLATTVSPVFGVWRESETIYLIDEQGVAVKRVDLSTGETEQLLFTSGHRYSDVLKGGLFAIGTRFPNSIDGNQGEIQFVSLTGEEDRPTGLAGFGARLLPTGQLLFGRNGNLYTVGFDQEELEVQGNPRAVFDGVALDSVFYQAQVAVSQNGNLAFIPGSDSGIGHMVEMARDGSQTVLTPEPAKFGVFDLSRDDEKLAIHVGDVTDYIWIFDLLRGEGRKLPGSDGFGWPVLSQSNDIVVASTDQVTSTVLRFGHLDGTVNDREIEFPGSRGYGIDWSPDEQTLSYTEWRQGGKNALLPLDSDPPEMDRLDGEIGDWGAVYSPDGSWLAYGSNLTGMSEIWIRPADGSGSPRQLSVNGGIEPVWCPCGDVFYRRGDEIWSSEVVTGPQPEIGSATLTFTMTDFLDTPGPSYDVSSDGQTLYYVQLAEPAIDDRIHVISNWLNADNAGSVQ